MTGQCWRRWLVPLVPLYWAGLRLKDSLRRVGVPKTRRLGWPVISVGSLSAGGAGKTPVVIALAELLQGRGWAVDVLSRGYGREGAGVERVMADAEGAAARFGDEPVLIAQRTGVPVWVGAERFAAGVAAEAKAGVRGPHLLGVHLLDDGFQHRQLARTLDVVLVTAEDLHDALLPAGNRREPLAALARADAVVVREDERDRVMPRISRWMRAGVRVWVVRRTIDLPSLGGRTQQQIPCGDDKQKGKADNQERNRLIAFCAIARPEGFFEALRLKGAQLVEEFAFPDHHTYTSEDIGKLAGSRLLHSPDAFITTEKDAVKLTAQMRGELEAHCPLLVAPLLATFVEPEEVLRAVEARIA